MKLAGTNPVGPSSSQQKVVKVGFPATFDSPPVVIATPLQDPSFDPGSITDTFAVTIIGVTNDSFAAWVWRVDSSAGWGQNLQLGWFATDEKSS